MISLPDKLMALAKFDEKSIRKEDDAQFKLKQLLGRTNVEGECLVYTGTVKSTGYPQIYWRRKEWRGNRLVYLLANGKLPQDKLICHTCDNRKCINPDHLYAGTPGDNMRDVIVRNRHPLANKTHCKHGHEFTPENIYVQPSRPTTRRCRICLKEANDAR